jgi:predicted permease
MSAPRWTHALLRRSAPPGQVDEILGDLEEAHRSRLARRGRWVAAVLTSLEALDMARALLWERRRRRGADGKAIRGLRAGVGSRIPSLSWLDFKLGLRMLVRHPGLTLVGGAAMAFGIAVGTGSFQFLMDAASPALPHAEGIQLVRFRNVDTRASDPQTPGLYDFAMWRDQLRSVEELVAFDSSERNLAIGSGAAAPASTVAIGSGAFRLTAVRPILGRPLVEADERPDANPVAVLSHALWQGRFGGDPGVISRVVRLGGEAATVVGVMPEDFGIPSQADLWIPLRVDPLAWEPGSGPRVGVLGRLSGGATLEEARLELAALGRRAAEQSPATHGHLRPELGPFPTPALVAPSELLLKGAVGLAALSLAALMVLLSANVALLFFARAAARQGELAVRSALGASRMRIVGQLVAEALALALVACVVGVMGGTAGLRWVIHTMWSDYGEASPLWLHRELTPMAVGWAIVLALVGATVAGVLPGLAVTGRSARANLQRLAGGGSGLGAGGLWTAIIVTQVGLTALLVPAVIWVGFDAWAIRSADPGLPAEEYLTAQLRMDGSEVLPAGLGSRDLAFLAGFDSLLATFEEAALGLEQSLEAEPGVRGVTFATQLPGGWHPRRRVEVAGEAAQPRASGSTAQVAFVAADFFDVMGAPVISGRAFSDIDADAGARVVVVNESFVLAFLQGRNAVGRRVRFVGGSGSDPAEQAGDAEYEIVGVVRDLAMTISPDRPDNAGIYRLHDWREAYPVLLAVHVTDDPAMFAGRLRRLATAVDPALGVHEPRPLSEAARETLIAYDSWFRFTVVSGAVALLLTSAGIYAILSYTVSRRTHEIGVRVALGADRRRVMGTILSSMARRVGLGSLVGLGVLALLLIAAPTGAWRVTWWRTGLVAGYMIIMGGVCALACAVPSIRALRIEPSDALRSE